MAPSAYLTGLLSDAFIIINDIRLLPWLFDSLYNSKKMCTKLMQIYQKRTPTFLAEITALVAALLLLLQHSQQQCGL